MSTESALKTKTGEAERFSIQAAALGASLEIRLYLPHSQAQGWRHTARQAYPRRRRKKKKTLSPPTPSHPSKVPLLPGDCRLTLSSASLFLFRSTDSPEPHRQPAARAFPVLPLRWPCELEAQPERTRAKKGPASGGEERGENAGPGDRGLGLCRPVELTPSSCPQRPSSQFPSALEFGVPCAPDGLFRAESSRSFLAPRRLEDRSAKKPSAPPGLGGWAPKLALEGLHDAQCTQPEKQCWGRGRCAPPAPYPPERDGCTLRNFPAPARCAREAQGRTARLPVPNPARRDRTAAPRDPSRFFPHGGRSPARAPHVPVARRAPGRESAASLDLLPDLGTAAVPPPHKRGRVRCSRAPRK